jgi:triphosphoribosyl-dephospho-CoA synthase
VSTGEGTAQQLVVERAKASFLCACMLDVAVRKPGNVSLHSAGHGMQADMFVASARAAAEPLFTLGASVGSRIEGAVQATLAVAGCNTNLGIVLLCAPLALAVERAPQATTAGALREALESVLAGLGLDDARAAYRAIALANPGGLGTAQAQDVHAAPSVGLRAAMALAAERDFIARQYRDGYADLFERALPALGSGFALRPLAQSQSPDAATTAAVQRVYLELLANFPDSHIVRKHGDAVAHTVMTSAQAWCARSAQGEALDAAPDFVAWDESLKTQGINPGTTADLTVACLVMAGLTRSAELHAQP